MHLTIQSPGIKTDSGLVAFIQKTIEKLKNFNEDDFMSAAVYLQLPSRSQTIKDKTVKITVNLPGRRTLFAQYVSKTFEASFQEAYDSIKNQLTNKQKKQQRQYRWAA